MLTAAGTREAEYETLQTQEEKALQVQRNRKQPQRGACQLRFRSRNTGRWVVGVCADSGPPPVLHDRVRYLWLALVHRLSSGVYVFRANIKGTKQGGSIAGHSGTGSMQRGSFTQAQSCCRIYLRRGRPGTGRWDCSGHAWSTAVKQREAKVMEGNKMCRYFLTLHLCHILLMTFSSLK